MPLAGLAERWSPEPNRPGLGTLGIEGPSAVDGGAGLECIPKRCSRALLPSPGSTGMRPTAAASCRHRTAQMSLREQDTSVAFRPAKGFTQTSNLKVSSSP